MGAVGFALLRAAVGHERLQPKRNSFLYNVFYVAVPVAEPQRQPAARLFSIDRFNVFSIFTKDHGQKKSDVRWFDYLVRQLHEAGIPFNDGYEITMISHPRLFGYAFNPISFWMITDQGGALRAVFCEVRNTFKQSHNYVLARADRGPISPDDVLTAIKHLYVSPFNTTEGRYEFRFTFTADVFKAHIHYFNGANQLTLKTYMGGSFSPLTSVSIAGAVVRYPAMTVLVVLRIHWQALKIWIKGVPHTLKWRSRDYANNQTTAGSQKIQK
jgi:uncharacterized protein